MSSTADIRAAQDFPIHTSPRTCYCKKSISSVYPTCPVNQSVYTVYTAFTICTAFGQEYHFWWSALIIFIISAIVISSDYAFYIVSIAVIYLPIIIFSVSTRPGEYPERTVAA